MKLQETREQLNTIDTAMADLFTQRMEKVREILKAQEEELQSGNAGAAPAA